MFPNWDDDDEVDEEVQNIIKAMMGHFERPWRWTFSHWKNQGRFRFGKKELALVKPEVVRSEVGLVGGNGKGVKRSLNESVASDGDEVDAEKYGGVKKKAKSVRNDGEFNELMKELQFKIGEGFKEVLTFVNEGFSELGQKMVDLTREVKKLKEENVKDFGVKRSVGDKSKDGVDVGDGKEEGDGGQDGIVDRDGGKDGLRDDGGDGGTYGGDGNEDGGEGKYGGDGNDGEGDGNKDVTDSGNDSDGELAAVRGGRKDKKAPRKAMQPKKLFKRKKFADIVEGEDDKEAKAVAPEDGSAKEADDTPNIQTAVDVLVSLQNPEPIKRSIRLQEKALTL